MSNFNSLLLIGEDAEVKVINCKFENFYRSFIYMLNPKYLLIENSNFEEASVNSVYL